MDKALELNLEKTYNAIKKICPKTHIDSFEAVREVEAYRQFWKPNRTSIVLLAESHVYTDQVDFGRQLNQKYMQQILPGYPNRFVRFVYCLGYGEDSLLNGASGERSNTGTPQFWKIFSYCATENPANSQNYKVLKTGTPNFMERMRDKIALLRNLQEKGIWLLDASIVGLYGNDAKEDLAACNKIIDICWVNYIESQIQSAQPKYIVVIGKGVENIVGRRFKVHHEAIDLPTTYKAAEELRADYRRYSEICTAILSGRVVPPRYPGNPAFEVSKPVTTSGCSVEQKLASLGYSSYGNEWSKGDRMVRVVTSKEFGSRIRVNWKDSWERHHAVIYDYSAGGGPVCVIPTKILFASKFVSEKRATQAYANSGYSWSQPFPERHELPRLILQYKDRWDLL